MRLTDGVTNIKRRLTENNYLIAIHRSTSSRSVNIMVAFGVSGNTYFILPKCCGSILERKVVFQLATKYRAIPCCITMTNKHFQRMYIICELNEDGSLGKTIQLDRNFNKMTFNTDGGPCIS